MNLSEHQIKTYTAYLDQLEAVAKLAEHNFPRNDHVSFSGCGGPPSGNFSAHYAFARFLVEAGRALLNGGSNERD